MSASGAEVSFQTGTQEVPAGSRSPADVPGEGQFREGRRGRNERGGKRSTRETAKKEKPAQAAPPFASLSVPTWERCTNSPQTSKGSAKDGVSVVSYNILAQAYVKKEQFPGSPPACLRWKPRSAAIKELLTSLDADFFCLQEVDEYRSTYAPFMAEHGYASLYAKRPGTKRDGSAVFFKASKFELVAHEAIDYDELARRLGSKDVQDVRKAGAAVSTEAACAQGRQGAVGVVVDFTDASPNKLPPGKAHVLPSKQEHWATATERRPPISSFPTAAPSLASAPSLDERNSDAELCAVVTPSLAAGRDEPREEVNTEEQGPGAAPEASAGLQASAGTVEGLRESLSGLQVESAGDPSVVSFSSREALLCNNVLKEAGLGRAPREAVGDGVGTGHEKQDLVMRYTRNCVGVMGLFRFRPSQGHEGTGGYICLCSTHLYWDPAYKDVKLAQAHHLLDRLAEFRLAAATQSGIKGSVPVVVGGDFNSLPGDPVYTLMTSAYGSLQSAYVRGAGSEPEVTTYVNHFHGAIDYMFTAVSGSCIITHLMSVPSLTELKSQGDSLPNSFHPSDHVPIGLVLELNSLEPLHQELLGSSLAKYPCSEGVVVYLNTFV